jgi:hypothetical protein
MKTKLDVLLDQIDPSRTLEDVGSRVNNAVNQFSLNSGAITDYNRFEQFLSNFVRHIENKVLRIPGAIPSSPFDWAKCSNILKKEYGINGHKTAFEMARSGIRGGLYEVLKKIATHLANDYAQKEISARVSHFWNALSMQDQFAVIEEYAQKYGRLLPPDFTEGSAVLLKMNFTKVLGEHPRMVQRFREAGRF